MILRMRSTHWLVPEGRALRLFRAGEMYRVSEASGRDMLRRGIAIQPYSGDIMTHYPPRLLTLITPPVYEPVTLAEVKLFLRVDGSEEDSLLIHLLAAARERAEAWMRRSLLTQTWQLQQSYTDYAVHLPLGPVQAVTQVQVVSLGTATTLAVEQYEFKPEFSMLEVNADIAADRIFVHYRCGYSEISLVPAPIKQAILHAVAFAYHYREEAGEFPAEARRMLTGYREIRL